MRRYAGFCGKREPALSGLRTPFSGVVISNLTASPPLNRLSIGWHVGLEATGDLHEGAH
jgi:hypothetical protein